MGVAALDGSAGCDCVSGPCRMSRNNRMASASRVPGAFCMSTGTGVPRTYRVSGGARVAGHCGVSTWAGVPTGTRMAARAGVSGVARNRRRRRRRKSDTRVPKRDEIPRECRPIGKVELRILKDEARVAEYWHAERLGLRCASKCEHGESNSEKVPHGLIPLG